MKTNSEISFEIKTPSCEDGNYILLFKKGGKTIEAPRFDNICSALNAVGSYIYYGNGSDQREIKIKVINN